MTKEFIVILATAILTENFVLQKFLGICPFLGVSNKLDSALGMSFAVIFVMCMSTAATWPIYMFMLVPNKLEYMVTIVFILVIAALVQLVETILKKYIPALHKALGVYLPLITTNCAVLGVTVLNIDKGFNFAESMVNSLGGGIGFLVAMVLFAGVRERLQSSEPTSSFQGVPITLVAASIVSLSFMGFGGVVEGMFR